MSFDAKALTATMERLIDVIERENLALEERRSADVAALQDQKSSLTKSYEDEFQLIMLDRSLLAAPGVADQLRDVAGQLEAALNKNTRLLRTALDTTQHLIKALVGATGAAPTVPSYATGGQQSTTPVRRQGLFDEST